MALLSGVVYFLYSKGKIIVAKIIILVAMAIPFFIADILLIFISLGGDRPYSPHDQSIFYVVNRSSVPLSVDACFSYTPTEIAMLKERHTIINPAINFITYNNVYIDNSSHMESTYYFATPIYYEEAYWPSQLYISFSDTHGNQLFTLNSDDLQTYVRNHMHLVITDHMIQSMSVMNRLIDREKGGDK